jgi:multidrug efflux pump subunit AcrA (membrane-fusion protein)
MIAPDRFSRLARGGWRCKDLGMSLDRPRFRRDLLAEPLEADGQRYVEVRDPSTGGSFRLYDLEYRVALAFDGLAFAQIIPWLRLATGLELAEDELREFASRLAELGLLEPDADGAPAPRIPAPGEEAGAATAQVAAGAPETASAPASAEPSPEAAWAADEAIPAATQQAETDVPAVAAEVVAEPEAAVAAPAAVVEQEVVAAPEAAVEAPAAAVEEEVVAAPAETVAAPAETVAESAAAVAEPEAAVAAPAAAVEESAEAVAESEAAVEAPAAAVEESAAAVAEPEAAVAEPEAAVADDVVPEPAVPAAAQEEAEEAVAPATVAQVPVLTSAESIEAMPAAPSEMPPVPVAAGTLEEGELVSEEPAGATPARGSLGERLSRASFAEPAPAMRDTLATPGVSERVAARDEAAPVEVMPEPVVEPEAAGLESEATTEAAAPWPAEPPEESPPPPSEPVAEAPLSSETIAEAPAFASESPAEEPEPARARPVDSTAFPVLPTPPPQPVPPPPQRSRVATPPVRTPPPFHMTPPVRTTPPPYVTPRPSTLGPLLVAHQAALRRRQRRSLLVFGSLGVLAAAAVLAIMLPFFFPPHGPRRLDVRTTVAAPGTVYRYFAGTGAVTPLPGPVMKFPAAGKVTRIASPGTLVAVGDVVAAVEAAKSLQQQLAHQHERLAFYQQIAEAMHQVGNAAEEERQAAKVEERKAKIEKTLHALARVAVVATVAGEVEEVFTREGETVEAGSLALRLRSAGHRATFELASAQAAEARRLASCQVGMDGYMLDCTQTGDHRGDTRVSVEIAKLPAALLGRPARLVRARFDGAVALPASAILSAGRHRQVFVVSPDGRVEARPVTVAELNTTEAIVVQGLDAGENVILDPAPSLRPGARVSISE